MFAVYLKYLNLVIYLIKTIKITSIINTLKAKKTMLDSNTLKLN